MLSAESAAGRYPVESVATMNDVAVAVENDPTYRQVIEASRQGKRATVADAITSAAREIAETTDVASICCFTHSGTTATAFGPGAAAGSDHCPHPPSPGLRRGCAFCGVRIA